MTGDTANVTHAESYWLCPLYSFDCNCKSVELAEGIQIRPAIDKLQQHIAEKTRHLYGQWDNPSEFKWVAYLPHPNTTAEGTREQRMKIGFKEWETARELLVDLITTLRLYHKGSIAVGPLITTSITKSEYTIGGGTQWTAVSSRDGLQQKPTYEFQQADIPEVNKLLQEIRKCREDGILNVMDITLRRFHSAYHGTTEDRIIDQMIAFEFLYIGNELGIKYKLALRTASLIGENQKLREEIFKVMKDAYRKRCNIVHVIEQVNIEELRKINLMTENYLRQSIRKFLALLLMGYSLDNIKKEIKKLAKLDENILKNENLLAPKE